MVRLDPKVMKAVGRKDGEKKDTTGIGVIEQEGGREGDREGGIRGTEG